MQRGKKGDLLRQSVHLHRVKLLGGMVEYDSVFLPRCMQCRRGLAMRILSVCLSVGLFGKCVHCDKTEGRSVYIFIPYERSFSLVFWEEAWLMGANRSIWNFGSTGPRWRKTTDFEPIFARSASAVTPSEKSPTNTNRRSTTRFSMSLKWSSYVAFNPSKGGGAQKLNTAVSV